MRPVKLLVLAAFAILVFGAVGTAVASAEETEILCLTVGCVKGLEGEFLNHHEETDKPTLELLTGQNPITAVDAHIKIKNCDALAGTEEKDTNLCKDQLIVFTGVEVASKKTLCQTSGAEKGEIKALLDLHVASEETSAKELQPLLLAKVLGGKTGTELVSPLEFKCSLINIKVEGTVACLLLPGLTNILSGEMVEILCKINESHDPETGKCVVLCKWLEEEPLKATNLVGTFEDAWELIHLLGTFNKDIFIDD